METFVKRLQPDRSERKVGISTYINRISVCVSGGMLRSLFSIYADCRLGNNLPQSEEAHGEVADPPSATLT